MHDKYIIIGCCPRSASVYTHYLLGALGLQVGHERPFSDGVIGWQQLKPEDEMRRSARDYAGGKEIVYLMQVRHPLLVINSMAVLYNEGVWPTLPDASPHEYRLQIAGAGKQSGLVKAINLYYRLHKSAQSLRWHKIYRIEAIEEEWLAIATLIGKPGVPMPDISRTTNTRRDKYEYPNYTWRDIYAAHPVLTKLIERMAARWGYGEGDYQ